jgi:hypothetical protein
MTSDNNNTCYQEMRKKEREKERKKERRKYGKDFRKVRINKFWWMEGIRAIDDEVDR